MSVNIRLKIICFAMLMLLGFAPSCEALEKLRLDVRDAQIRDVLQAVAQVSSRSLVTDGSVQGTVSITLRDAGWQQALEAVAAAGGLEYRLQDGIIIVTSASVPRPGRLSVFTLNYVPAADAAAKLKELAGKGSITADPAANSILFTGTAAEARRIEQALQAIDIPARQITLEAKLIAVSLENNRSLGLDWNWDSIPRTEASQDEESSRGGSFRFWRGYRFNFGAALNALITEGKARVLATPRIITIPGREASLFIGDHIPVQTEQRDSQGSYTTTEYVDAGIKLKYTPVISSDGSMVTASVHTEVSTPVMVSELNNYRITSRSVDTSVRMRSGETLVIGGLISEQEQRSLRRIPLLADIPLLGGLFKSSARKSTRNELIMLLTPYVTEAGRSPAIYSMESPERYGCPPTAKADAQAGKAAD